jgi:ABC-type lipoprotein release transport system permease subunit
MTTELDRDYYRACPDRTLVEMARHSDSELALVLGEALAEALSIRKNDSNYIDALEANVARLDDDNADLKRKIDDLTCSLHSWGC